MSSKAENCNDLKKLIREVPDFPKPGILFYDITTLLKDRQGFARLIDSLSAVAASGSPDALIFFGADSSALRASRMAASISSARPRSTMRTSPRLAVRKAA